MSPENGHFGTSNAAVAAELTNTGRTLSLRDRSLLVRWSNDVPGKVSKAAPNATTAVPSFRIVANKMRVCWNTSLRGTVIGHDSVDLEWFAASLDIRPVNRCCNLNSVNVCILISTFRVIELHPVTVTV